MLKDRNALITGSSSGIGLGIARRFAAAGMNVVMNGIESADQVEQERIDIEKEHGVTVVYKQADMSKPEEVQGLIETGESRLGSVDVLVNNAGIQFVSPVEEFPTEKWDAIIAINLSSAFHTIKWALPGMKQRGWGRVINIASAHGLVASPYKSAYVAAKHGILGLTKTVALETAEHGVTVNAICPAYVWTPLVEKQIPDTAKHGIAGLTKTIALETAQAGITVNAICPGYVWTPLVERQIPDTMKARNMSEEEVKRDVMLHAQPTKQFVTIEQVAELACFLCGDSAGSITGASLSMDGGWTAQ